MLKKIIQKLSAPRVDYQPLIEVRVFKDALLHNLGEYQKHYPKLQFAPVLKSNAYGHGLVQVAEILDGQNLSFFMVDTFFEALALRRENIKTKILILGYVRGEQILNNKLKNFSFGVIDFQQLKNICKELKNPQSFHLKIDTGMHRQGILKQEIPEAIKLIKANNNFILEGACTHFAEADGENKDFTNKQILEWNEVAKVFKQAFPEIKFFHASNSAGAAYSTQIDANVSRLGIGLYGINMSPFEKLDLKPALEMVSIISSIKHIQLGEKVGYGITFEAQKPTIVATVPVGYTEGVDRRLSNKGFYKVKNVFCPLAGRVSMNMSSIDVSEVPNVKLEDEVIIISKNPEDKNSVENIAKQCDCIPYEILVRIPQHLRRTVL
jgi:alanine racemase